VFKRNAVQLITVRGYPVREVSRCLGVSSHALYRWMKLVADPGPTVPRMDHEAKHRRPKRELAPVSEERDIPKEVGQTELIRWA
jgi:transposase